MSDVFDTFVEASEDLWIYIDFYLALVERVK